MKVSIRQKMLISFTVTILISIIATCIVLGLQIRQSAISSFQISTGKELAQIDRAITIFFDKTFKMATMISEMPSVKKADESLHSYVAETKKVSPKEFTRSEIEVDIATQFKLINTTHPEYVEVYMGTKWGGFASSSDDAMPAGYDPRKRPWYLKAMESLNKASVSPAYMSTSGEAVIGIMHPILAGKSEVLGCAGVDVGLGGLTDLIKKSPIGKSGYVILVQDDGVILANPKNNELNFKKMTEANSTSFVELAKLESGSMEVTLDRQDWYAQVHTIPGLKWKLIGVIEKSEVMDGFYDMLQKMTVMAVILIALCLAVALFFANTMARPILSATSMLKDVAKGEGDLTRQLTVTSADEIGEMAGWFNTFLGKLRIIIQEVVTNGDTLSSASTRLLSISSALRAAADEAARKAEMVTSASHALNDRFSSVASSMDSATQNTNMVAAAAEEMAATITEISSNTDKARTIAHRAVDEASAATKAMSALGEAARDIGKVTSMITEISEQTNLLALNATIEAARAGDAGRGFAVVANEIKELARQTSTATEEIKNRISEIQGTSDSTAKQIKTIATVIEEINEIIATVATAIEEQSAATREIAGNVAQASQDLQEVNVNVAQSSAVIRDISSEITDVNKATESTRSNTDQVAANAEELRKLAANLYELLGKFKTS